LFDINRAHDFEHFIADTERDLNNSLESSEDLPFRYTLITNASGESYEMVARTRTVGASKFETTPLNTRWPNAVYSLSHVSLPFAADDRWYGDTASSDNKLRLGAMAPRGETAILMSPIARFMRLRYNPFFDYLAERTLEFCDACDR
jgi:hypothetical protein